MTVKTIWLKDTEPLKLMPLPRNLPVVPSRIQRNYRQTDNGVLRNAALLQAPAGLTRSEKKQWLKAQKRNS